MRRLAAAAVLAAAAIVPADAGSPDVRRIAADVLPWTAWAPCDELLAQGVNGNVFTWHAARGTSSLRWSERLPPIFRAGALRRDGGWAYFLDKPPGEAPSRAYQAERTAGTWRLRPASWPGVDAPTSVALDESSDAVLSAIARGGAVVRKRGEAPRTLDAAVSRRSGVRTGDALSWLGSAGDRAVFLSREPKRIVFRSWMPGSGRIDELFVPLREPVAVSGSPEGERVAYLARGDGDGLELHLVDLARRHDETALRMPNLEPRGGLSWHPGGRALAFVAGAPGRPGELFVLGF